MRPLYRGPAPTRTTGRGQQVQQSEEYGFFRKSLVQRLGEYCSYCEVPLGASLAVEHIVSKGAVALLEVTWDNFVLACTNCNSTKGSQVDIDNVGDYYFASDTSINTFQKFRYQLVNGAVIVAPAVANDRRAVNTIALTQLNRQRVDDSKASDRRLANRTNTWMIATELSQRLAPYYRQPGGTANADPAVQLLKDQIKAVAVAHGFWSVWMTVFGATDFGGAPTRDGLLCELFVSTFPGTNYPLTNACPRRVPADYTGGLPVR